MSPISALGFIAFATMRNMLRRQLRRIREPRYLVATLFGLFYVVNILFQPGLGTARAARRMPMDDLSFMLRGDVLAWVGMMFILFAWVFGGDESGLTFTEAEIQLLFPAPLTRRQLIHYKLVRSLLLAWFGAFVVSLSMGRTLGAHPAIFAFGAWLGLSTLSLHLVAASLTRLRLLQQGLRGSARRALVLLVPAVIVGSVLGGLVRAPDPWPAHWPEVKPYLTHLLATAPLRWASLPLLAATKVAVARRGADLWPWLPVSFGVLALHYLWALSTGASFEEASLASAERRTRRIDGMRRGQLTIRATARPPFKLSAHGAPAMAIYWKNLTAAVRVLSLRMALVILLPAFFGGVGALVSGTGMNRELGTVLCGVMAGSTAFFGVQIYRIDFRLDLAAMDLLKSFPIPGVHLAVAEVMAPFTVLTLVEWLFLSGAVILAPADLVAPFGRVPIGLAAMVLLPALTLPGLMVQNAAALLFPAWVESGTAPPRGVEAIGQRLLTMMGTLFVVTLALVPAAGVAGVVGALLHKAVGAAALPAAAVAGAMVVAGEAALGFFGLGRAFEKFDPGRV